MKYYRKINQIVNTLYFSIALDPKTKKVSRVSKISGCILIFMGLIISSFFSITDGEYIKKVKENTEYFHGRSVKDVFNEFVAEQKWKQGVIRRYRIEDELDFIFEFENFEPKKLHTVTVTGRWYLDVELEISTKVKTEFVFDRNGENFYVYRITAEEPVLTPEEEQRIGYKFNEICKRGKIIMSVRKNENGENRLYYEYGVKR